MSAGSVDCSLGKEKPFIRVACFNVEHLLPSASFSHIAELGVPCGYQNHFLASSCAERLLLQKKALPAYSREPWPARIIDLMQIINRVLWDIVFLQARLNICIHSSLILTLILSPAATGMSSV